MVNPMTETPIPLAGRGFLPKLTARYNPGEYKKLVNMEINQDGYLINRRNIYSCRGAWDGGSAIGGTTTSMVISAPFTKPQRFLGHLGEYTLVTTAQSNLSKQYAVGTNTVTQLFGPYDMAGNVGSAGSNFVSLIGYFRYNNKNYWIAIEYINNISVNIVVYSGTIPLNETPASYNTAYAGTLTRAVVLTFNYNTTDYNKFGFKNFFMYKDRLWIALSNGLYFSKATDPAIFAVPDGGFFKHPNNSINYVMADKDVIYTLCADSIFALNYSTDPNVDSTERPVSETIGGEMGCVHVGQPYVINNLGIFSINGLNLEKILDNEFDLGRDFYSNRIVSFENYLVVQKYQKANYLSNNTNDPYYYYEAFSKFEPFQGGNSLGYNLYFINTDTGTTHVVNFVDQYDYATAFDPETYYDVNKVGFIVDLIVNPLKDANGNYKLFFLTNKFISNNAGVLTYTGDVYFMNSARDPRYFDYVRNVSNAFNNLTQMDHMIEIEIDSFLPDGLEYRIKKFRSLLVEGLFPGGMNIFTAFDSGRVGNAPLSVMIPTDSNTGDNVTVKAGTNYGAVLQARIHAPYVFRFPLNQRARSLSLKINNKVKWAGYGVSATELMLLSDLRVLWTPTNRAPITNGTYTSSIIGS